MKYDIFISYRRSDGKAVAQFLKKTLVEYGFEDDDIFLDFHDILAETFPKRCHDAIHSCQHFILLITKDSFVNREGEDYYYNEIRQALEEGKHIVPIIYETVFNKTILPEEFREKQLHLQNGIRLDMEYHNDSMNKIVEALTKDTTKSFLSKIVQLFAIPMVFITIYLMVSIVGGVIKYVWDNYFLSDQTCTQIAVEYVKTDGGDYFYYCTKDSIYIFNKITQQIDIKDNTFVDDALITLNINRGDLFETGFGTLAIGMVYEITKMKYKPHGNSKQVGVIIAAGVSIIAGFGLGFVCERMLFPVQISHKVCEKLHSPDFWQQIVSKREAMPNLNHKF